MKYDSLIKNKTLVKIAKGMKFSDIAKESKISKRTIYNWKKQNSELIMAMKDSLQMRELIRKSKNDFSNRQILLNQALNIGYKSEYQYNSIIQSQVITILVMQYRYDEALAICNKKEFLNELNIQSQKITILIKLGKYSEALEICNRPDVQNFEAIQSQKITIFIKLGKYLDALEICNRKEFQTWEPIQMQKIAILLKLTKYKEALDICNLEKFKDADKFLVRKRIITNLMEYLEMIQNSEPLDYIDILNKIKNHSISLTEIESLNITDWYKTLFKLAYYEAEKISLRTKLNLLSSKIRLYGNNLLFIDLLKKIKIHIEQKIAYFDITFYLSIFKECSVLPDLRTIYKFKNSLEENEKLVLKLEEEKK